jgi:hypothetical protein
VVKACPATNQALTIESFEWLDNSVGTAFRKLVSFILAMAPFGTPPCGAMVDAVVTYKVGIVEQRHELL